MRQSSFSLRHSPIIISLNPNRKRREEAVRIGVLRNFEKLPVTESLF